MPGSMREVFQNMKKHNKVLFSVIVAAAIILFWKGTWGIADIVFDEWIFQGHLFWSNLTAAFVGILILLGAGVLLDRLT